MEEAIRLVLEENYRVKTAAQTINSVKRRPVPRTTLQDRLHRMTPNSPVNVGRPQELPPAVEAAIVKALKLCGEFQHPMRKKDLQLLVQAYCSENDIKTRWEENLPGLDWIRGFRERWKGEVRLKKPTNIKRSRAMVSPAIIREFMGRLEPNLQDVPPSNIFNYDETNVTDDPGTGI